MENPMNNTAELSTVIRNFLPLFNAIHKLPAYKLRTLDALQKCRTEYLGGHIEACEDCGEVRTAYNSCRNSHCPKCEAIDKEKWITAKTSNPLFHSPRKNRLKPIERGSFGFSSIPHSCGTSIWAFQAD